MMVRFLERAAGAPINERGDSARLHTGLVDDLIMERDLLTMRIMLSCSEYQSLLRGSLT